MGQKTNGDSTAVTNAEKSAIPAAVRNFKHFPDEAVVNRSTVAIMLGVSLETLYRMEQAGEIAFDMICGRRRMKVGKLRAILGA